MREGERENDVQCDELGRKKIPKIIIMMIMTILRCLKHGPSWIIIFWKQKQNKKKIHFENFTVISKRKTKKTN